jgi:hypothetical protein
MSKQSGKIRAIERRQAAMEEQFKQILKHQALHSRHILLARLQLKKSNKYMECIHEKFIGSKEGKKGILDRLRTVEVRQKGIIRIAFMLISAAVIGFIGWFK